VDVPYLAIFRNVGARVSNGGGDTNLGVKPATRFRVDGLLAHPDRARGDTFTRVVSRSCMTFNFGLLGGKYVASPRIGGQLGFSMDFPAILHKRAPDLNLS
jgi:hypothetical protein